MRRRADQQPPGQPPAQRPRQDQRVVNPTPIQTIRGVEQRPAGEAFNQTTRRVVSIMLLELVVVTLFTKSLSTQLLLMI